jgi:hypothetical protein
MGGGGLNVVALVLVLLGYISGTLNRVLVILTEFSLCRKRD